MNIQLDEEQMKLMLSEALLTWLGQDKREALVKGAIEHLLTSAPPVYGSGPRVSPIQSAFNSAVCRVAEKIAETMLNEDTEIQARLKSILVEAVEKLTVENREQTVKDLASRIAKGLSPSNY